MISQVLTDVLVIKHCEVKNRITMIILQTIHITNGSLQLLQ